MSNHPQNLFTAPNSMNTQPQNLFTSRSLSTNMNTTASGMNLRSGANTSFLGSGGNNPIPTNTNLFTGSNNAQNFFTTGNGNPMSSMNMMSQNRPMTNSFIGAGDLNPMNKSIGSIEEKFVKQNHRYYKANDIEKNLYYGCLLAQSRHKDKNLEMVRLEDYSLIKNMNIPDELKGIIKKCVSEKVFNEQVIREDLRQQFASSSYGINPMIFSSSNSVNPSFPGNQNPASTPNTLSFLGSNTAPNQTNSFFQKPTLAGNSNMFSQPMSQNTNLFNNPMTTSMNIFSNNSASNSLQPNAGAGFNNVPSSQSLANSGLFKPPSQPLSNNTGSLPFPTSNSNPTPFFNQNPTTNLFNQSQPSSQQTPFFQSQSFQQPQPMNPSPFNNFSAMPNQTPGGFISPNSMNMGYNQPNFMGNNSNSMYLPQMSAGPYNSYQYPPMVYYSNEYPPLYSPSKSLGFTHDDFNAPDKNFLFVNSKKINNINLPMKNSRVNEPQIIEVKDFMSSPWGVKNMLYDMNSNYRPEYDEISLRQVDENITGNPFKNRKIFEKDNFKPKIFLNDKTKENISHESDDMELIFNYRPKRFLESLENERVSRKGRSTSPVYTNNLSSDQSLHNSFFPYHVFSYAVVVNVKVDFEECVKSFTLKISKHINLGELKEFIFKKRCKIENPLADILVKHSFFQIRNEIISDEKKIESIDLGNYETLLLCLDKIALDYYYKDKNHEKIEEQKKENQEINPNVISKEFLPKLTKENYVTIPNFPDLLSLDEESLKNIENFSIMNEHGRIDWEGFTDITYQDLDEIIDINEKYIEVYPSEIYENKIKIKPKLNSKLNKPAILTFNKCPLWKNKPANELDHNKILNALKDIAIKRDCELIKYNSKTGEWKLKVKHFTKYGFIMEEEDSSAGDENQNPQFSRSPSSEHQSPITHPSFRQGSSSSESEQSFKDNRFSSPQINKEKDPSVSDKMEKKISPPSQFQQHYHPKNFSDFNTIQEEIEYASNYSSDEMQNENKNKITPYSEHMNENEEFQMAFDGDDQLVNENDDEEDESNIKRLKEPNGNFKNIATKTGDIINSSSKKQLLSNTKNEESDSNKSNNFYDFPDEISDHSKDQMSIEEEEKEDFNKFEYNKENKETLQRLVFMENKLRYTKKNIINIKPKTFYQNYSFRVSWCSNGFVSLGKNSHGTYQVNQNKIIVFQDLCKKTGDPETNYSNYENITRNYNRNLQILFKALSEKIDLESVETNIKNLSFQEQSENQQNYQKYSWPEQQNFMRKIFLYMHNYAKNLQSQQTDEILETLSVKFYEEEFFDLALMNILFGNPKADLLRYFTLRNFEPSNFHYIMENFNKKTKNTLDDHIRKILLNKWLEAKSEKSVREEIKYFCDHIKSISGEQETMKCFKEILKIYLSGNQIYRASELAKNEGFPKAALAISTLSNKNSREILNKGFSLAKQCNAFEEFILNDVYKISSGEVSAFDELDLKRWLGVYFWFSPERNEYIAEIFHEFLQAQDIYSNFSIYEKKPYCDFSCILIAFYIKININAIKTSKNIFCEKFKFLADPLKSLHSLTVGKNILDKKIIWLFSQLLFDDLKKNNLFESFSQNNKFNDFYLRLSRNFVAELEYLGLWDLSIIVIVHISEMILSVQNKNKWIQSIIHRNSHEISNIFEFKQKQTKLMKFSVPSQYFAEAHAIYNSTIFNWTGAIYHFNEAEDFLQSNHVLIQNYISENILVILELNNLEEKKDRLNELSRHIKLFLENNKYENSTRINLQTALFEQIIALIKIFISKNNNNIGKNELFERSFATLNSDILHYLKIENPIDLFLLQKIQTIICNLIYQMRSQHQPIFFEKLPYYERFLKDLKTNNIRNEIVATNKLLQNYSLAHKIEKEQKMI